MIMSNLASFNWSEQFEDIDYEDVSADHHLFVPIAYADEIYENKRAFEAKRMPSTDFVEMLQKEKVNGRDRACLFDWLVEVIDWFELKFGFSRETLFLTVNYVDRFLSGNSNYWQHLQLLGVACLMIAYKFEERYERPVAEFFYVVDNKWCKKEILQIEFNVLKYLNFDVMVATPKLFVRLFVDAMQRIIQDEPSEFECLANYIAELSLLDYDMLHYLPSIVAASAIFLAKFVLFPSEQPWDSILRDYTEYQPSDLEKCVKKLHLLFRTGGLPELRLPTIRKKYSKEKYYSVARKHCRKLIPQEFFQDIIGQQ